MNEHLTQWAREWIGCTFNRHRPGQQPSMVLFSSRRSGTTVLAQAIGMHPGVKVVDQPLSPFTASLTQLRRLPPFRGGLAMFPDEAESERIHRYFQDIESGRLHVREPWRVWTQEFNWRSNRIFYKCTDAHAVADLVVSATCAVPLSMFRHPIPQALSCMRRSWGTRLGAYLQNRAFVATYLAPDQVTFCERIRDHGSELERYVLDWVLENLPILPDRSKTFNEFLTYEWLVTERESALEAVCRHYGLALRREMASVFGAPSRSSKARNGSRISSYLRSGDAVGHLKQWLDLVPDTALTAIDEVLATFGIDLYTAFDAFPRSRASFTLG